jgi:hypothetical protein
VSGPGPAVLGGSRGRGRGRGRGRAAGGVVPRPRAALDREARGAVVRGGHLCGAGGAGRAAGRCNHGLQVCGAYVHRASAAGAYQQEFDTFLRQIDTHEFAKQHPGRLSEHISSGEPFSFDSIILPQIRRLCIEVVRCARDRLQRYGRGFEWLGVDLMVTEGLRVQLIEVNVSPNTTLSTPLTARLVPAATRDLFSLVLDEGGGGE